MDSFESIPNDILLVILNIVLLTSQFPDLKDQIMLVCKRWNYLVNKEEKRCEKYCLEFRDKYKGCNLSWIQKESGKSWTWFHHQFTNNFVSYDLPRSIKVGQQDSINIGGPSGKKSIYIYFETSNGVGVYVSEFSKYIGSLTRYYVIGVFHGQGTLTYYKSGVMYKGGWYYGSMRESGTPINHKSLTLHTPV
jgi:hypothetical protein